MLRPIAEPGRVVSYSWQEPAPLPLLELLRRDAELQSVGRSRFKGTLAQRNRLWHSYRNFLRQALSNFRVALTVENRSASLLYYYAMLNFAKAELLSVRPAAVAGFVAHGLSFKGSNAKTIGGDFLTVQDGVFRLLYEKRTGYVLPVGARLPVKRLLANIPEIGEQLEALGAGTSSTAGVLQLVALDDSNAWTVLALTSIEGIESRTASGRYFNRAFKQIDPPADWRDRFGVSRRWQGMHFFESLHILPHSPGNMVEAARAVDLAANNTWKIRDLLGLPSSSMWDARLVPSLYRARMVPMPPSLARYAMAFYASSLVRYRPAMFDSQVFPEQAYLFDSIARECAIPMLVDTLSALTGEDLVFLHEDSMRI